jgi:hypothetical protein
MNFFLVTTVNCESYAGMMRTMQMSKRAWIGTAVGEGEGN